MESQGEKPDYYTILLFFNSASGSGVGQQLKNQEIDKIDFNLDGVIYDTYFYSLRQNRQKGMKHLRQCAANKKPVIAVICGGDGTVMWVVSQLYKYGINPEDVLLAIIPLGTGNDFSRSLGWGKGQDQLTEESFKELRKLIREWRVAHQQHLDLWQVQIEVQKNGRFQKVQSSKDVIQPQKTMIKHFVNYFSFGVDGQIGYQFDKRRTDNRLGNMAVYGAMGLKSSVSDLKSVGQLVEVMTMGEDNEVVFEGDSKGFTDFIPEKPSNPFQAGFKHIQNFFSGVQEGVKHQGSFHTNQNILALNINSFMAGAQDIWKNAKENDLIKPKIPHTEQSHLDGKIEFVSFSDSGALGMQKTVGGFAEKIVQGQGPFVFKFKEYPNDNGYKTFFQIDGEFIKARHPKQVILRKSSMFPGSKIKILRRRMYS